MKLQFFFFSYDHTDINQFD